MGKFLSKVMEGKYSLGRIVIIWLVGGFFFWVWGRYISRHPVSHVAIGLVGLFEFLWHWSFFVALQKVEASIAKKVWLFVIGAVAVCWTFGVMILMSSTSLR